MGDIPTLALEATPARDPTADLDARFRRPLMKFFLRRVHHLAEAEDLTQEVFARALSSRDFGSLQRPDSFLFTVATNLLRDRHRAHLRRTPVSPEATCEPREPVEDRGPERVLQGYESLSEVLSILDELSERTRDIFILFRLENMKQRDIALAFGITVKAVEKHVLKAVTHLARRWARGAP
jgi:RNA polymerase sigma factor (sigma-70 family)